MAALYAALGEKAPAHPERVTLMPSDRRGFVQFLFGRLGGRPSQSTRVPASREEREADAAELRRQADLAWVAEHSLRLIQFEEAIGRPPEFKEFGVPAFEYHSAVLADDVMEAWERYIATVHAALADYQAAAVPRSDALPAPIPSLDRVSRTAKATAPARAVTPNDAGHRPWLSRFRRR